MRFDGVTAEVLHSSPERIDVRAPETVHGESRLELISGGRSISVVDIPVDRADPGIYTWNRMGMGPALATNADGTLNSDAIPARLGSVITLYVNGVPDVNDSLRVCSLTAPSRRKSLAWNGKRRGFWLFERASRGFPIPIIWTFRFAPLACVADRLTGSRCGGGRNWTPRGVSLYLASP